MSDDRKKPLDPAPTHTPDLLQKDMQLDRRRRVPSFEELQTEVPTDPDRPKVTPRAPAAASPKPIDNPPTISMRGPPNVPPQPPGLQPRAPDLARTLPPSPQDWADQRTVPAGSPASALPQVTPGVPSQGAGVPPSHAPTKAAVTTTPAIPSQVERQENPTLPAGPVIRQRPPSAVETRPRPKATPPEVSPSYRDLASELPPEMLVTQPDMPNPIPVRRRPAPASPQSESSELESPSAEHVAPRAGASVTQPEEIFATPASLWRRLFAWLVDASLLGGVVSGLLMAAMTVIGGGLTPSKLPILVLPAGLLLALLAFVYASLFAFLWHGRTPGRLLLGLHLVDSSGHPPSPTRALVRGVLALISFALCLAGFWLALFDRRGQTLHDKLSRTFVVRLRPASSW